MESQQAEQQHSDDDFLTDDTTVWAHMFIQSLAIFCLMQKTVVDDKFYPLTAYGGGDRMPQVSQNEDDIQSF